MKTIPWLQAINKEPAQKMAGGIWMIGSLLTPDLQSLGLDVFCGHCSSGRSAACPLPTRGIEDICDIQTGGELGITQSAHHCVWNESAAPSAVQLAPHIQTFIVRRGGFSVPFAIE